MICKICLAYVTEGTYEKHMRDRHSGIHDLSICTMCGLRLQTLLLVERHMHEVHGCKPAITACPKCKCLVRVDQLDRHLWSDHNIERVRPTVNKINNLNSSTRSRRDRAEARRKAGDQLRQMRNDRERIISNKEIADYLARNPIKDEIGRYGVPQDPFRWRFYGSKTMNYDSWRKGDKNK